jgi:hypothetical protein
VRGGGVEGGGIDIDSLLQSVVLDHETLFLIFVDPFQLLEASLTLSKKILSPLQLLIDLPALLYSEITR